MKSFLLVVTLSLAILADARLSNPTQAIKIPRFQHYTLPNGVELWKATRPSSNKPPFFVLFEELAKVFIPSSTLPFDRSVAFLAGVSRYNFITPDLPFVRNDLEDMRTYLLQEGGFDEVYVATESIVSAELIEDYMMNKFRTTLSKRDRLLFYYAGHGADLGGQTGYLQFASAQPGNFARQVLAISRVLEWGDINPAGHMLFVLDTCSSGLAFTSRSGNAEEDEQRLIQTLSGRGSRTVISAGTAGEESFEIPGANGRGNGVFTRALLGALQAGRTRSNASAFLTVDQVFAELKVTVAKFASIKRKPLNPRLWTFDDDTYRGSFIFLNPALKNTPVSSDHLGRLSAQSLGRRKSNPSPRGSGKDSQGTGEIDLPQFWPTSEMGMSTDMATEDPREYPPDNAAQNPRRCVVRATIKPLDASLYLDKKFIGTSADILKSGILVDRVGQIFAVIRPGYRDVNLILGGAECTKGIDVVLEKNR